MTEEILCGDRGPFEGPFEAYSLKRCYLKTPTDTYLLHVMFPRLARALRRRTSEERGAVGTVPAVRVDFSGAGAVDAPSLGVPVAGANGPVVQPPTAATLEAFTVGDLVECIRIGTELFHGDGSATPMNAEGSDGGRNTDGDRGANRIEEDAPPPPS